jgi:hypothetical protein
MSNSQRMNFMESHDNGPLLADGHITLSTSAKMKPKNWTFLVYRQTDPLGQFIRTCLFQKGSLITVFPNLALRSCLPPELLVPEVNTPMSSEMDSSEGKKDERSAKRVNIPVSEK